MLHVHFWYLIALSCHHQSSLGWADGLVELLPGALLIPMSACQREREYDNHTLVLTCLCVTSHFSHVIWLLLTSGEKRGEPEISDGPH